MYARILTYKKAKVFLFYGGADRYVEDRCHVIPITDFFKDAIYLFFRPA